MREQIEAVEQEKRQLTLDRERLASRIAAVEEKSQTSPGPARWELNTPFTDYLTALSRRLADHLPSSRHDREKLADRAKVSITTIEKLLRAEGNSTIHTLYSIANARGLRLSTLFEETERELEAARSRHKPPAR
jgi:transcriptional regulator with XRE-family HTH domain